MSVQSGLALYESLLREKVAGEEARKASLEQRGLAVITTSGVLVTLILAVGALAPADADVPWVSRTALGFGLTLFVLAACLALRVNAPRGYAEPKPDQIEDRLRSEPAYSVEEAVEDIALTRVTELRSARAANSIKAVLLQRAITAQTLAVIGLSVAVLAALL